jgi:hypothetical protein
MRLGVVAENRLKRAASFWGPQIPKAGLVIAGALIVLSNTNSAHAQDGFYEVETKYIFGFTEGSGVGLEGEKEFSLIGLEAGPLSQWLFSALAEAGLPVICVETRHMRAALKAQINKTDRNDAASRR